MIFHLLSRWQPPSPLSDDTDIHKTLIVGFPSGDKRLAFSQMEALTGLATKDEWDVEYLGLTNDPFIKTNYPHHEGLWSWGNQADQVVLVMRDLRSTLVEYHDILWDIGYAKTYSESISLKDRLYTDRPPLGDFLDWRDMRVLDEIHWYGWYIDYWMEGGLMRDIFSHKLTTPEHWNMLLKPTEYKKNEIAYDFIVGGKVVTPSYDPHCINDLSGGCEPVAIISAEHLVEYDTGPSETRKIANILLKSRGISDYVIKEDAWECVWRELIVKKKGLKTSLDREGSREQSYNFSQEMLEAMMSELDRLITKYISVEWESVQVAPNLVELLLEHRRVIHQELTEIVSGERRLKNNDFLGPNTRARMAMEMTEKNLYW